MRIRKIVTDIREKERNRIKREASIGLKVSGKNLVKIYDYKIDINNENGTYLIMEFINGITLDKWIELRSGWSGWPGTPSTKAVRRLQL